MSDIRSHAHFLPKVILLSVLFLPSLAFAVSLTSTTTLNISICGDGLVNSGEACDVPGEVGAYSTTIAGRQCTAQCVFGPYCGDTILQSIHGEECDDGNNTDDDFCSAVCIIEPAATGGGGGSSGGGGGSSGGSTTQLGDTQIDVTGIAYPSRTVHILLDGEEIGTVNASSDGSFDFSTEASPGATTMGFWAEDSSGTRSTTFSTTFDVTLGAITNINGVLLPPTIRADTTEVDPGDTITFTGQAVPDAIVEIHIDDGATILTTESDDRGLWTVVFDTSGLSISDHTAKPRFITGDGALKTESNFGSALSIFVGVEGVASTPSDLNRDGSINLIDFSILIFWWQTTGGDSDPPADISGNGLVSLEDFSILLFNWTG